ncbi:MAG: phosphate ABC transporter permease subunit PstC [Henriciella sp.]|nr:phosphate ABC transporter permease subunit PstC [Henriciella sp.]MBO6694201.1 phosphate ABC transporter permease subunit PstC [Henriciella sp.]
MLQTIGHLPIGWLLIAPLAAAGFFAFSFGRTEVGALPIGSTIGARLHSQPNYHGYFLAVCTILPAAAVSLAYLMLGEPYVRESLRNELPDYLVARGPDQVALFVERVASYVGHGTTENTGNNLFDASVDRYAILKGQARLVAIGAAIAAAFGGFFLGRRQLNRSFPARVYVERTITALLFVCAAIAILTTVGIVLSLVYETIRFFSSPDGPGVFEFLFGTNWNAQTGQNFGAVPLFFGTLMIALLAMCVAVPVGLFSAIYLSEYASPRFRSWVKPILELLAGIPTVVYGFFAATLIAPLVRGLAEWVNALPFTPENFLAAQPTSALAAGLVMGVMIIPFVSSLSDDVINAVPQPLRDGALAVGATKSEAIKQVVLPAALPGIIAAILLAVSRAIGETMIVVMAAGGRALITLDPTSDITTVTYQIVSLLTGDTAFDSSRTLSAFALGFTLFGITLFFNLVALRVVKKYREAYD